MKTMSILVLLTFALSSAFAQLEPWSQGYVGQTCQLPGLQVPPFQQPWLQVPQFQQPGLQVPPFQQPGLQVPGLQVPPFQQPGLQMPPFQQQGLQVPPFQQPGLQVPPFQQVQQFQQQLNPCKVFIQQQCSPVALPFIRSQSWQQSSCQVMRQQCCQQLAQIPQQYQCHAISSVVQAIFQQQQQQQQQQQGISFYQPHISPLQIINLAQNIPTMCNVHVPTYGIIIPYTILA